MNLHIEINGSLAQTLKISLIHKLFSYLENIMIYYSIIPKNINHITITHADFIGIDKVTCKLIIISLFNRSG